jgi:hypothetical protein
MLPTLRKTDGTKGPTTDAYNTSGRDRGRWRTSDYGVQGLLPTLTVDGNYNRKGASPTSGDGLATALARQQGQKGPLHPCWCEAFMSFPVGWTAPSESPDSEIP